MEQSTQRPSRARLTRGLLVGLGLVAMVLALRLSAYAENGSPTKSTRPPGSTPGATTEEIATAKLQRTMEKVLATQQDILARFDEVMEELRIIKIRATMKSGN